MHIKDSFIGEDFSTPDEGVLRVIGSNKLKGNKKRYKLTCSICNEDTELFPLPFLSTKCNMRSGHVPCGCSNTFRWSEDQQMIRVIRHCSKNGLLFHGWSGDYRKAKTKLALECTKHDYKWVTSTIDSLVNTGSGCHKCGFELSGKGSRKDDREMFNNFMCSDLHEKGTRFWRSNKTDSLGRKNFWWYECPTCLYDEYTTSGVGRYHFEVTTSNLHYSRPCRCSTHYYWGQSEREYQINKVMEEEGNILSFLGWLDGKYTGSKCYFYYACQYHGENKVTVDSFLLQNTRCPSCCNGGFNPSKPAHLYLVKWFNEEYTYIKFGITNREVITRIKEQADVSLLSYEIIQTTYFDLGQDALNLEDKIKASFKTKVCPKYLLPDGYTETVIYSENNLKELISLCNTAYLTNK